MSRHALTSFLLAFACVVPALGADQWGQFRGPGARGVAEGENLPETWSATQNVRWKHEIPGLGWSSPIAWGDRVFVTTVVSAAAESPKKGLYLFGERFQAPTESQKWQVLALDLNTGETLWEFTAHEGTATHSRHIKNSYASETPITDGERVYAYFGDVGLFCLDMEGRELWRHPLEGHATRFGWGPAASPALFKDRLFVVNDNDEASYLLALDAKTGEEVWKVDRDETSNWATPYIWENELRTEIITPGTGKVRSYGLDGTLLYEFGGMSVITIPTPFSQAGLLYVSSGYILDSKRPIFAIRPGASGDITLADEADQNDWISWCQRQAGAYNTSPLVLGDKLYVLLDRGFLTCYDARTGQQIYDRQRLPRVGAFTASPWGYNDKVFCLNEDGETIVVQAGGEFKVLSENALEADDMCLATPAVIRDMLLIRSSARLYCIQSSAPAAVKQQ